MHCLGVKIGKISIDAQLVFAVSLVHPAIQQDALAVYLQQMLGTGRRFSCSAKVNFHQLVI